MELTKWFEKGMTFQQYVDTMTVNQEELQSLYQKVSLNEEEQEYFGTFKGENWKVIVLTADWCGDALLCVPILKRVAEVADFSLRFLIRDENLELMDQYLTNGSRSIPIFIFLNSTGKEVAVWGPRSKKVQERIDELRASLPPKEDPSFEEKQKEMYQRFRQEILIKPSIWQSVKNSLRECLQSVEMEKEHV